MRALRNYLILSVDKALHMLINNVQTSLVEPALKDELDINFDKNNITIVLNIDIQRLPLGS